MTIDVGKNLKLHLFIFALISWQLFPFSPIEFIHIAFALFISICVLFHLKNIKFVFTNRRETILFLIVNFYLFFAIFGYDLFVRQTLEPGRLRDAIDPGMGSILWLNFNYDVNLPPSNRAMGLYTFLHFALGFIWTGYVLQSLIDLLKFLSKKAGGLQLNLELPLKMQFKKGNKNTVDNSSGDITGKKYWIKWLVLFSVMAALFMVWQRAYIIAMVSPDSWHYLWGWLRGEYLIFRSPVYSFLLTIILTLAPTHPEVEWIVFVKIFAFSALLSTVLMYFHKKGIRFKYMAPFALILPAIPSFGLQPLSLLPDLANGMSMLWFTYAFVRILDEVILKQTADKRQKISFCIQLCLSLVFIFFMRPNSFPVFLFMAPVLALLFFIKKQWKLFSAILLSVTMVLLIQFPGKRALDPQEEALHRYFAGLHDILAVYHAGGNLSERTLTGLGNTLLNFSDPGFNFMPGYAAIHFYEVDFSEFTTRLFLSMYLDAFLNNPGHVIRSILFRIRPYWAIDPKGHISVVNFTVIVSGYGEDAFIDFSAAPLIGVERPNNRLTILMNEYIWFMNKTIPTTFIWRFGVWTALMVISAMLLIQQKRRIWLLTYLPVFIYLMTLVLTSGWPDHRYGLPIFFIGMFLPAALILLGQHSEEDVKHG